MDLKELLNVTDAIINDEDVFDEVAMMTMKAGEVAESSLVELTEDEYNDELVDHGTGIIMLGMQMCSKAGASIEEVEELLHERMDIVNSMMDEHDLREALKDAGQYREFAHHVGATGEPEPIMSESLFEIEDWMPIMQHAADTIRDMDSEPTEEEREVVEEALEVVEELYDDLDDGDVPDVDRFVSDVRKFMDNGTGSSVVFATIFDHMYDTLFKFAVRIYTNEYHKFDPADDKAYY